MNSRDPLDPADGSPDDFDDFEDLEAELLALGDLLDAPDPPPSDVSAAVRARLGHPGTTPPTPETAAPETAEPETAPVTAAPGTAAPETAGPETAGPETAPGAAGSGTAAPVADPVRPRSRRDSRAPGRRARRTRWAIVAAVVVAVITVTAATPQGRAAVTQLLRFAGVELRIGDAPPAPVTTPTGLPGEHEAALEEARRQAGFPLRVPSALGPPYRVTVSDGGRLVSMFWPDGMRLDQFDGAVSPFFFKQLGPPYPDQTRVGGREGWWIPGEHPLGYLSRADGTEIPLRQASPTLLWQRDELNYRLEGAPTATEAVRVAESLR